MSFQKINEKTNTFISRVNNAANTPVFSLEVKNEKTKKFIFLFFILLCISFVFGLYKMESASFLTFVIFSIIFISIYLYYFFQPLIITKIIFYTLILLFPISIYFRLQKVNRGESELAKNIIVNIAPQFLKYQYYILFGAYALFEILLRLLSRYSQRLRAKIQENPFVIRLYFIIILGIASIIIEILK